MVTKRVYPDTNVALYYRPFDELDWRALVGADEVVVVLTSVFLREVEDLKDRGRGQLQQRARRVSKWLGERSRARDQPLREGVRLELSVREPELDIDFAEVGLVATVNDDKFIACMLRDRARTAAVIVCVTSDVLLTIKAGEAGFGFDVIGPPWRKVADEPDALELENRQLKQKLVELERRASPAPDLALQFVDGQPHTTVKLFGLQLPDDDDLEVELAGEHDSLELLGKYGRSILQGPPSPRAVERYLRELREWMGDAAKVAQQRGHTFALQIDLANSGPGNASDIEVTLTFPDDVFVAKVRTLQKVSKIPERPEPEDLSAVITAGKMAAFALVEQSRIPFDRLPSMRLRPHEAVRLLGGLTPSHALKIAVDGVKHQSNRSLPAFETWCSVGKVPSGFAISYRIHAASTPEIREGKLHVKIEVAQGPVNVLATFMRPRSTSADNSRATEDEVTAMLDEAEDLPDE